MSHTYEHARPALTVDAVVFGLGTKALELLLIQRDNEPFRGRWALPGGFVQMNETLEAAVRRELEEETGLAGVFLEQLYTFGDPGRDPRGRTVTVAYYALVQPGEHRVVAASDARAARWYDVSALPRLAFDHDRVIETALARLKGKLRYQPIGFELLPRKFTLTQLQKLYETILERALDKRNFRKKVLSLGILEELDELESGVARRPARLYRFDEAAYKKRTNQGFLFEI